MIPKIEPTKQKLMINTTCGTGMGEGGGGGAGHKISPPCLATIVCNLDQEM